MLKKITKPKRDDAEWLRQIILPTAADNDRLRAIADRLDWMDSCQTYTKETPTDDE